MRWQAYRGAVRRYDGKIRAASVDREAALDAARTECSAALRGIKSRCRKAREKIRARARAEQAKARASKREAREHYDLMRGAGPKAAKYSRAESDSLAEHNIPPELLRIWREDRRRYSYDDAPDMRAEAFLEWAEAHVDEIRAREQEHLEATWDDLAYARAYAEHDDDQDEREAVPF